MSWNRNLWKSKTRMAFNLSGITSWHTISRYIWQSIQRIRSRNLREELSSLDKSHRKKVRDRSNRHRWQKLHSGLDYKLW